MRSIRQAEASALMTSNIKSGRNARYLIDFGAFAFKVGESTLAAVYLLRFLASVFACPPSIKPEFSFQIIGGLGYTR